MPPASRQGGYYDGSAQLNESRPSTPAGAYTSGAAALLDVDLDGDADAPGFGVLNPRALPNSTAGAVAVTVVGRDGGRSQHGAVVALRPQATGAVAAARVVGMDGGNTVNQGSYRVVVPVPAKGVQYEVCVWCWEGVGGVCTRVDVWSG